TEWLEGPASDLYQADPHVALFRSARRCYAALAAWHHRERLRLRPPVWPGRRSPPEASAKAEAALAAAGGQVTEREAKDVLGCYGVPVIGERLAKDLDGALSAAAALGYPVALKVESPDILHKTEAGIIRLGIAEPASLRVAYNEIMTAASRQR